MNKIPETEGNRCVNCGRSDKIITLRRGRWGHNILRQNYCEGCKHEWIAREALERESSEKTRPNNT